MVDLHLHTTYSDGSATSIDMLTELENQKIKNISFTDHDTTMVYKELSEIDVSKIYSGKIYSGIEITTFFKGSRIEILGYGFDNYQLVNDKINEMNNVDFKTIMKKFRKRILKQFDELNLKYDDKFNDVEHMISVDRYEVKLYKSVLENNLDAKEKMQEDYCYANESFFRKCIANPKSKFYCDYHQYRPAVIDAINLVHDNGGLCFYAHPYGYSIDEPVAFTEDLIKYCIENNAPLDGIETYYYNVDQEQINQMSKLASKYSLLSSGGSDCHGLSKNEVSLLGKYLSGNVKIKKEDIGTWLDDLPTFYENNN